MNSKKERLNKFEDGTIVKIPEEKMKESEKLLEENLKNYKKAKKVVTTILDSFGEGMELSRKELSVSYIRYVRYVWYINLFNYLLSDLFIYCYYIGSNGIRWRNWSYKKYQNIIK